MRLGDLDALKKRICEICNSDYADDPCEPYDCFILNSIKRFPTIDAVSVVRCRECKRWSYDTDSYGKDDGPKGRCMKSFEETYADDFFSYGRRKEAAHEVSEP